MAQPLALALLVVFAVGGASPRDVVADAPPPAPPALPAPPLCGAGQRAHFTYNGSRVAPIVSGLVDVASCCLQCAQNPACLHYTWHPLGSKQQPTWCELQADDGAFLPSHPAAFVAGSVAPAEHRLCSSSSDCSLAGECVAGRCKCDGWTHGPHCEVLNLEPVDPLRLGYRNTSGYNSWGGASIFDDKSKRWFLFASQIQGRCPLSGAWSQVSQGVRLHGDGPTGPWTFDSVILPSEAHNVKPFRSPTGEWLIFYVGAIDGENRTCTPGEALQSGTYPLPKEAAGPVFIASAAAVDAPAEEWKIHGPM